MARLFAPSLGNILPGITKATILEICKTLDNAIEEKIIGLIDRIKRASELTSFATLLQK